MFQVYAIIGASLSIPGIICVLYFIRFILTYKADASSLSSLSESLITVFIGIFYIYSAVILSTSNMVTYPSLNFTNNIDDITIINNTEEMTIITPNSIELNQTPTEIYQNDGLNYITSTEESYYPEGVNNNEESEDVSKKIIINYEDTTQSYNEDYTSVQTTTIINKNDQYLINYQNFFKDIINQKLSNLSTYNRSIFNNKVHKSLKTKTKRDLQLDPTQINDENDECFKVIFLMNAGLLYSFIHCILTLIDNTLNYKKCGEYAEKESQDKNSTKSSTTENYEDTNSEKNDSSAPVGPLFDHSENPNNDRPNLELFRAKTGSFQNISASGNSKEEITEHPSQYERIKLVAYIFLIWSLPIIALAILYSVSNGWNGGVQYDLNYINLVNLNSTRADPNILNIIHQKPFNVSSANPESTEINKIIKNVYSIVNEANENVTNKKPYFTPPMTDITNFWNVQNKNSKNFVEQCPEAELPLRIYYFFIFVVIYFLAILYAKTTQIAGSSHCENSNAKQLNTCILAFSILWLPSVLDLFIRVFLIRANPNIVSHVFLALGNTNRLFTMTMNYYESKKIRNKRSLVKPVG